MRKSLSLWAFAYGVLALGSLQAWAQPGYSEVKVDIVVTGEELANQPGLWVMEVYFKPMRFIVVDVTDPKTGEKRPMHVWYLAYRAVNRPLASPTVTNPAVNELDAPVLPPKFVPQFTLVTAGRDEVHTYHDQVIPEAMAAINRRERRNLENSVSVVRDVPAASTQGADGETFVSGVATFLGVDPDADRYTVYLTGFSNGVMTTKAPDGTDAVQHKTIEMKYWRPGDRFDQDEPEIRLDGTPRWIYR